MKCIRIGIYFNYNLSIISQMTPFFWGIILKKFSIFVSFVIFSADWKQRLRCRRAPFRSVVVLLPKLEEQWINQNKMSNSEICLGNIFVSARLNKFETYSVGQVLLFGLALWLTVVRSNPCAAKNCDCIGCSASSSARPSMVVTSHPLAR